MRKALAGERAFQSGSSLRGMGRAGWDVDSNAVAERDCARIAHELNFEGINLVLRNRGDVPAFGLAERQSNIRGAGDLSNSKRRDAEQKCRNRNDLEQIGLPSNAPIEGKPKMSEGRKPVYLSIGSSSQTDKDLYLGIGRAI